MRRRVRFGHVRAGRQKFSRKSVLVTERVGDEIFFGMSSCNLKLDKWNKEEGINKATERLELALRLPPQAFENGDKFEGVHIHSKRFLGRCDINNAVNMIKYFQSATCCR